MLALTRDVSDAIVRCELTHVPREPIDVALARVQHEEYERALESLGCTVCRLPADDTMPDSVFIEDTAVVLPELAIVARPGAESRRREVAAVREALAPLRRLFDIEDPGTLDGGDVLVAGRAIFAGRSTRTNDAGIEQLRRATAPHGYTLHAVLTSGCLHLKSAATALNPETVLLNPAWIAPRVFAGYDCIDIDPAEAAAANVVSVNGRLIAGAAFTRTAERLECRGFEVVRVDARELARAEGALTCCSLLVS
jgi:dimethylargininase